MIIKGQQLARALANAANTRLFLFYGPDEGGSRNLLDKIAAAVGAEAERIDLAAADLKSDPARLVDEAAAISMFGGARYIVVERAGDEILPAVTALIEAEVAGNPVVILAGELKKGSKLLKAVGDSPCAVAFASYAPEGAKADQLVLELARAHGLIVQTDVAHRVAESCGGGRAVIDQELSKFATYLDSSPQAPKPLEHEVIDALGAGADSGNLNRLAGIVAAGNAAGLEAELIRLRAEGIDAIPLIRAMLRRMGLLAKLRAEVEQGRSVGEVMASAGKSLFWKEKDAVGGEIDRWRSSLLAKSIGRLAEAERQVKASGGPGPIAAEEELFAICRQAARLR
jgi:DNA polymerase III subunit delta